LSVSTKREAQQSSPTHCLISRQFNRDGSRATRILDLFGNLGDQDGLRAVLGLALRDAVLAGSHQVTALVTLPEIRPAFGSLGFLLSKVTRFCWHTSNQPIRKKLSLSSHWLLADSDNDPPN